jgi:GNAT superfamily N-acetyltransferase
MRLGRRLWKFLPWRLKARLLRSQLRFDAGELERYRVHLAQTREQLLAASRLVYSGFRENGAAKEHPAGIRYSPFWLLPTTHVLVGEDEQGLGATLSLIIDGALGIPMARIRPDLVAAVKAEGRTVAEVGSLTVAPGQRGRGLIFLLYKALYLLARGSGVDDLLIGVQPHAVDVYRALLCFEPIGPPLERYPGVESSVLVTPMRLRLRESLDLFRARFGHLKPGWGNPLYLYTQRHDPGIQLPPPARWADYARARLAASTQLITTRPDVLLSQPEEARRLVLDVLLPGAQP